MFRFTIRDVAWLTVVVALGAALMLERQNASMAIARANKLQVLLETLANFAVSHENWEISTTDSSIQVIRPQREAQPSEDVRLQWTWSTKDLLKLKTESLTREFKRESPNPAHNAVEL